jgi:hypothetical protein
VKLQHGESKRENGHKFILCCPVLVRKVKIMKEVDGMGTFEDW